MTRNQSNISFMDIPDIWQLVKKSGVVFERALARPISNDTQGIKTQRDAFL